MCFRRNPPAPEAAIAKFEESTGFVLPHDYASLLLRCNGGEGFVRDRYVMLWGIEELEEFNRDYQAQIYLPGFLLFGSNGGGEAYAFRVIDGSWSVVTVPFIGMAEKHAVPLESMLTDLIDACGT